MITFSCGKVNNQIFEVHFCSNKTGADVFFDINV